MRTLGDLIRRVIRRRQRSRSYGSVADLAAASRRQLAIPDQSSAKVAILRAHLAGVEWRGPIARAPHPADETPKQRAAFLAGHLQASLIRAMGTLPWTAVLPVTAYATSVVLLPAGGPETDASWRLLNAHLRASLTAETRGDLPMALETAAFRWLGEVLAVPITPQLLERFEARRRRLRAGLAVRKAEGEMDPAAAAASRIDRHRRHVIANLERQLESAAPGSAAADRLHGALAGISDAGPTVSIDTGVGATPETSEAERGGRLGGHLLATLIRGGQPANAPVQVTCHLYGAALASAAGRALLAGPAPVNVLKAHALGLYAIRARSAEPIDEDLEIALLAWLASQLQVPVTEELLVARKRYVARPVHPPG